MSEKEKTVYLTFDDGPHPEATPFVLDVLKAHDVQATFFLLGKNAVKHPELVKRIQEAGHTIGNHGMQHLNGWVTNVQDYLKDMQEGKRITDSNLFRPAYGKLTYAQYKHIKVNERIVLWDLISGDFDQDIEGDQVVNNVLNNVRNGSIIVMHDSEKAHSNVKSSLNEIIVKLGREGYTFATLQDHLHLNID